MPDDRGNVPCTQQCLPAGAASYLAPEDAVSTFKPESFKICFWGALEQNQYKARRYWKGVTQVGNKYGSGLLFSEIHSEHGIEIESYRVRVVVDGLG